MQAIKNQRSKILTLLKSSQSRLVPPSFSHTLRAFASTNKFSRSSPLNYQFYQIGVKDLNADQAGLQDLVPRPKKTQIQFMCKGAFPLDRQGTHMLPKLPTRSVIEDYLASKKVDEDILIDHFGNMFTSTLDNIAKRDYGKLEKLLESKFYETILQNKDNLERFNLSYDLNKVDANESFIIDKMLIKGLYHDRSKNGVNYDYMLVNEQEHYGIRFYLHKYFVGYNAYYLAIENEEFFRIQNEKNEKMTPDDFNTMYKTKDTFDDLSFKLKKRMQESQHSMILRVTFQFRDTNKALSASQGPEPLYDPDYTGNHIIVFENQLTMPSLMAMIDHSEQEFINLRKLNFKNWRIVDIDNYMKGNSFFQKHKTDKEFTDQMEFYLGINDGDNKPTKEQKKDLRQDFEKLAKFILSSEPRSNRGLERFIDEVIAQPEQTVAEVEKLVKEDVTKDNKQQQAQLAMPKEKKQKGGDKQQVNKEENGDQQKQAKQNAAEKKPEQNSNNGSTNEQAEKQAPIQAAPKSSDEKQ
ncbi:UNKNOWN [Stylonychia lemnae]|uniref:Uncharacterized protein n=1 Tax=Stylonychia lemnae TaxID=5949 RepID=A0A078A8M6_STYLE|nr:UNKNOWN [Stylonychia lemnae]|eukprot:CDW78630.1 UNKNOWN [Stylonychia lemnae]